MSFIASISSGKGKLVTLATLCLQPSVVSSLLSPISKTALYLPSPLHLLSPSPPAPTPGSHCWESYFILFSDFLILNGLIQILKCSDFQVFPSVCCQCEGRASRSFHTHTSLALQESSQPSLCTFFPKLPGCKGGSGNAPQSHWSVTGWTGYLFSLMK